MKLPPLPVTMSKGSELPMNKTIRFVSGFALVLSALAVGGCGSGSAEGTPAATQQTATTRAPLAANAHGFVKIAGEALGEVPLRPEQRTELEKIAADSEA